MAHQFRHFGIALSALTIGVVGACSSDKTVGNGPGDSGTGGTSERDGGSGGRSRGGGSATGGAGGRSTGGASGSSTGGISTGGGQGSAGDAGSKDAAVADGGECTPSCSCGREETCDYSCSTDCTVQCLGGTCTAGCARGGCTFDADFGGHADYTCLGGGCHTDCDNGSSCNVDCSGGGCDVLCDAASTCSVTCKPTGAPCTVTCENGGVAECLSGNCVVTGCGDGSACDPTPDPTYKPMLTPANFTSKVDNPFSPFPVGGTWTLESSTELINITVLPEKKTILGIECVVVRDTVKDPKTGELIEDTYDWFAQNVDGSVWYFGEDTKSYSSGVVVSTHGTWEAGVNGALPGIVMPATPKVTTPPSPYRQEYLPCEAEDQAEVIAVAQPVTVTSGTYQNCIRTREFTRLDPAGPEFKTYCSGIGNVLVEDAKTGERLEQLSAVKIP